MKRKVGPYLIRVIATKGSRGWTVGLIITRYGVEKSGTIVFCDGELGAGFVFRDLQAAFGYGVNTAHREIMRIQGKAFLPFSETVS